MLLLISLGLVNSCGLKLVNTRVCTVAGDLRTGANCAWTLSDATVEMTEEEFLAFISPSQERPGAVCQSMSDYNKNKTALEQACTLLGPACVKVP